MPRDPRPAPVEPTDLPAYFDLLGRCIEAPDEATLLALIDEGVRFEGGRFASDFEREWWLRWQHLGLPLDKAPVWPKTPFTDHGAASSAPDSTT